MYLILCMVVGCATTSRNYSPYVLTQEKVNKTTSVKKTTQTKQTKIIPVKVGTAQQKKVNNGDFYIVKKGDTLFSISFENNIELKTLALINDLVMPYTIKVGQRLLLNPLKSKHKLYKVKRKDTLYRIAKNNGLTVAELRSVNGLYNNTIVEGQILLVENNVSNNLANTKPITEQKKNEVSSAKKVNQQNIASNLKKQEKQQEKQVKQEKTQNNKVKWLWPNKGSIVSYFSERNKGIDIGGVKGSIIKSAAYGKIVYAGNALRGYGNLIIINHNDDFLSAYAHNDKILVSEGEYVKAGQEIARMGDTDAKSVRLHFEIRYKGQSVNPLNHLPKR
ncbi:MAG: peptidoglycan DD-metalloendopeptidase family protein [Succinivibrionaceae bacterium]